VAPTQPVPITATIPARGGFIAYAPSYAEMPGGFQGSVVVDAAGLVVGVSNNVNYDVPFDGSAAYNMPVAPTTLLGFELLPNRQANDANADGRLTVQLPVPFSVPVLLELANENPANSVSFADPTTQPDQNLVAVNTNANGQLQQNVFLTAGPPATFTVNVYYDANNNGILDAGDVLMATGTFTIS